MSEEIKTEEVVELTEAEKAKAALMTQFEDKPEEEVAEAVVTEEVVEEKEVKAEETEAVEAEIKPEEEVAPETTEEIEAVVEEKEEVKPDNAAFARMRHEKKLLEKQLEELKTPTVPTSEAVEKTVDKLVKVWESGEGDDKALLSGVRNASSQELQAIYEKAINGVYGDNSDDVITMISRELPMIQNRETAKNAEAQTHRDEILRAYDAEAEQAVADFPKFAVEGSDEAKALEGFKTKSIGTLDLKTGELDGKGALPDDLSLYLHSHPYALQQLATNALTARTENSDSAKVKESVLTKEVATLKAKLAKYEGLGNPSGAVTPEGTKAGTAVEAKAKLMAFRT